MATYILKIEQCAADLSGSAMLLEYQHNSLLIHHLHSEGLVMKREKKYERRIIVFSLKGIMYTYI